MVNGWCSQRARECACGSGQDREPHYDGRGIFLTYACPACEAEKLSRYRPEVLTTAYQADEPIEED